MVYLVAYDVGFRAIGDRAAQKRLSKIRKLLLDVGHHRQLSFFECLVDRRRIQQVKRAAEAVMDLERDSLRIYPACDACLKRAIIQGCGERIEIRDYEII